MKRLAWICFIALLPASFGVLADSTVAQEIAKEAVHILFTETEKKVIREYFEDTGYGGYTEETQESSESGGKKGKKSKKGMPPGLAKRKELPPGLQRQLERNGTLPPGLQKKALPSDLQTRLPREQRGYERVIVDTDVLLVETATGVIRDIIQDVLK
jgi:Ni/Co efflux regulator RcnB